MGKEQGVFNILFGINPVQVAEAKEHAVDFEAARKRFDRYVNLLPQIRAEREEKIKAEKARREKEKKEYEESMRSLEGLLKMTPMQFETAVGSLLLAQGWRVLRTPASGDRGIDFVATKGREKIAVQCKRYLRAVGERVVREFYGSFVGHYDRGILITTAGFTSNAANWAKQRKSCLQLMSGEPLARLMVRIKPQVVDEFEEFRS